MKFIKFTIFFFVVTATLGYAKVSNAAYRDSTTNSGTSASPSVAVPSGVQANDIVILVCSGDDSGWTFTGNWPANFNQLYDSNITADGQSAGVAWKRLTSSDSGSYTLSDMSSSTDWVCQAFAFSGRNTASDPTATANIQNTGQSSPVSVTATGVTAGAGDDLLWVSAPDVSASGIGNGHSAPTNYTEVEDAENGWSNISGATRQNVASGATGNITGTFSLTSGTSGWAAFLVKLPSGVSSLWTNGVTPSNPNATDGQAIELGTKFTADYSGQVTGVRFYKGTNNTGTHIGNLWTTGGTQLATVTFSGESATGWQTMSFSSPVDITAGTTYVVSYFSPTGYFAIDSGYFNSTYDNAPLHAPSTGSSGGNGMYLYTASNAFPSNSGGGSNYWVDVVFKRTYNSAAVTGTITSAANEGNIRSGGKTIILTLTGDTWVGVGATFDAQRQNIINGIDSAQSETHGWDAEVKAKIAVTDVVRTSDTIVTITLDAEAGYDITLAETITATIPATALAGGTQIVASPTFTVAPDLASVYYSVGQNATNHSSGGNVSITSGLATFTVAQVATNLGVGDRLTAGGNIYYLSSKISTTQWNVITKTGTVPADLALTSVTSIAHEYTSLSGAIAGALDANHIGNADLTAVNVILNIPCYYDSATDTGYLTIDGYTTGTNNYIKIYTPSASEANQNQRPSGKWDAAKYNLTWNADVRASMLVVSDNHVRIDGLQVGITGAVASNAPYNAAIDFIGGSAASEYQVSNSVIFGDNIAATGYGIAIRSAGSGTIKIWNNLIYGFVGASDRAGVELNEADFTTYLYNNTLNNCYTGYKQESGSGTVIAKNNIAQSVTDGFSGTFTTSDYNISSVVSDAPSASYRSGLATTVAFVNAVGKDLHLASTDTGAKNQGTDLSGDANLPFSTDDDSQTRPLPANNNWDIGADELSYSDNTIQSSDLEKTSSTSGLVGYWSFDGADISGATAYDRSGSSPANNGTISGAVPATGKRGQALDFDGTSGNVSLGNMGSGIKTIAFWIKADDITTRKVIDFDGTDQIEIDGSSNILATSFPGTTIVYVDGSVASTIDSGWHHVAITDTTGVNGSAAYLGKVASSYFDGILDEVRFYNRVLSADEVGSLYRLGEVKINSSQNSNAKSGLVGEWSFNGADIYGNTAYDRSVSGNNGTISGAVPATGKRGQALSFDGTNDQVSVGGSWGTLTNTYSFSIWIKPVSHTVGYGAFYFLDSYYFLLAYHNDNDTFCTNGKIGLYYSSNYHCSDGTTLIPYNEWSHVVVTSNAGSVTYYINGVVNGTASGAPAIRDYLIFGDDPYSSDHWFQGSMDEIRWYNRVLTADEVGDLYRMGQMKISR